MKENWEGFNIQDGALLMLLGSVDAPPSAERPTDMEVDQKQTAEEKKTELPAGLVNLGNTCYMNASLQVMSVS